MVQHPLREDVQALGLGLGLGLGLRFRTLTLTLALTLALTLTRYKPFLDRLSLDKVENIPRYITETATVLIAVTTNLFESYWCAVELCKAVECHAQGTLNIILCPIQNDMWLDSSPEGGGAKLPFPTPAMVMANFGKWFPDLKDSTRELIELLYGGGPYTESRTVYHTLRWPGLG